MVIDAAVQLLMYHYGIIIPLSDSHERVRGLLYIALRHGQRQLYMVLPGSWVYWIGLFLMDLLEWGGIPRNQVLHVGRLVFLPGLAAVPMEKKLALAKYDGSPVD